VKVCRETTQRAWRVPWIPRELDRHNLRHWLTTRAIRDEAPIPVVADWLGHKDGGVILLRAYRHSDEVVNRKR
jgi:integrase